MTPAEEIETIIHKSINHEFDETLATYEISSFPEIYMIKITSCYTVRINKNYYKDKNVIKRYEEIRNAVNTRKILIQNQIIDRDRGIAMGGVSKTVLIPIYYKDCIFTEQGIFLGETCENCIIEGE